MVKNRKATIGILRLKIDMRLNNLEKRLGIKAKVFDEYHERIFRLEGIVFKLRKSAR